MELREKIAFIVSTHEHLAEVGNDLIREESMSLADAILAIPKIAEALEWWEMNLEQQRGDPSL